MTSYAAHVQAYPDCIAQTPEEMAVEAALAMGGAMDEYGYGSLWEAGEWHRIHSYTDPVHATELLAFTALGPAYISVRVYPVEFADGMRWYAEFESEVGCREEQIVRDTFPAASTTACLLALRQYWRV